MWLKAPNLSCKHGFSTRNGGVSSAPFHSLNLGGSQDKPENILANRNIALAQLGVSIEKLCLLKQVHGVDVRDAKPGFLEGDALVTNDKSLVLAVSAADCYPILFHDNENQIIGAAHAGWRGTVGGIAGNVVNAMIKLGAKAENIQVAIGQGISMKNFEVGNEVIDQFGAMQFPESCFVGNHIDLIKCNLHVLSQNNILTKNIYTVNRCTFEDDFFSYRRDNGITGRMWGLISM